MGRRASSSTPSPHSTRARTWPPGIWAGTGSERPTWAITASPYSPGSLLADSASDDDGDLIRGLFLASHEVDGTTEWQVRDGQLVTSPAATRHQYLDG